MSVDDDPDSLSLLHLFREEAQTQTRVLSDGLLALEHAPTDAAALEACMRAAHSLKGAARIIGLQDGVDIAHALEECFVDAQRGKLHLSTVHVDRLLRGVDLLLRIGDTHPAAAVKRAEIDAFVAGLSTVAGRGDTMSPRGMPVAPSNAMIGCNAISPGDASDARDPDDAVLHTALKLLSAEAAPQLAIASAPTDAGERSATAANDATPAAAVSDADASVDPMPPVRDTGAILPGDARAAHDPNRMLRVRADNLDRLLGLSGESLVESRRLKPFAESMLRAKRTQRKAILALDSIHEVLTERLDPSALAVLNEVRETLGHAQQLLGAHLDELDQFDRRGSYLAQQIHTEALQCRMRPFGDATHAYPRIVRDFARSLGKRVRFSIVGETTQVDRDILDMLDAPLGHLLRNALDHGVETPDERTARGKPAEARLTLEARHSAGKLLISVSDDGAGIDPEAVRATVVRRRLADKETAASLSDPELLEFLLLPGFSMREHVTDVSGRGVGLDVVHQLVKSVRGAVRIFNQPGRGTRFVLQLPLTLSVVRSLLVQVGGEPYAIPLAHVHRTLELARTDIDMLEGQQHFSYEGRPVGLVTAHQLLGAPTQDEERGRVAVVVIGDERETYGVAVDRFLGERTLAVQPLDSRLGKVKDIAAGALMENGEVVLIVDIEDLLRSVTKLVHGGQLEKLRSSEGASSHKRKQVLIVDDSLTVRELERKLLEKRGYAVTVATDGMDGWNALRSASFDLVITDIDMPRMDGIELVTLIKRDALLKTVPVMIVSYKDRDEDRRRGLDVGADYYLAKSSFHDEALLDAVHDLIGEAQT
jgi:two-component system, chemotaxis family, sensor histidine kinase and response regulator WspE